MMEMVVTLEMIVTMMEMEMIVTMMEMMVVTIEMDDALRYRLVHACCCGIHNLVVFR